MNICHKILENGYTCKVDKGLSKNFSPQLVVVYPEKKILKQIPFLYGHNLK